MFFSNEHWQTLRERTDWRKNLQKINLKWCIEENQKLKQYCMETQIIHIYNYESDQQTFSSDTSYLIILSVRADAAQKDLMAQLV